MGIGEGKWWVAYFVTIRIDKGYAKEKGGATTENRLFLFPVSRLRIPKIPDFC